MSLKTSSLLNECPLCPNAAYGPILLRESKGRSDYLALASSFTRRYRDNYQVAVTYTLMFSKHDMAEASSGYSGAPNSSSR